jgi:type II secretion system protein I
MRRHLAIGSEDGFTLIEILITLVIFSVGIMALAGLQVTAIKANAFSKRMTAAIAVAEAKLEQIKDTPYANVQSESPTQVVAAGMNFTRQVTVTANSPVPNTKTVQVMVTWTEGSQLHTVPISTIINQP